MVEIKPFKGILYNKEKIKDFGLVITPPYDVISEEQREVYFNKSPYNFVNLILTKNGDDKYDKARQIFEKWQEEEVLKQDEYDTIYVYNETYMVDGKEFSRLGFISLLGLEKLGEGVLPHEKTLEKPFKDRLELMKKTKAHFGMVFLLYDDREKIIDTKIKENLAEIEPYINFVDDSGVSHQVFRIQDKDTISFLRKEMEQHQCIIADGHHRYKTALAYAEQNPDNKSAKYAPMCFVNSFNEGMIILPTNRVVFGLEDIYEADLLNKLRDYFDVEEIDDIDDMVKIVESTEILVDKEKNLKNHVFGFHDNINGKSYVLKLKDNNILESRIPDATLVYKRLDVKILHKVILEEILGISEEEQSKGTYVEFVKGSVETINKLDDKKYQFAFFVNPPLMREIFLTARANETMPQKSTYFYPKVYSGLVINKID
ncbi:MAG: DUF1015 domain-containing protein [Nanoarchaeota archaeon]